MAQGYRDDLPDGQSEIFFARGLDTKISVDWADEIELFAQVWRLKSPHH
jgi:hypothetical protein